MTRYLPRKTLDEVAGLQRTGVDPAASAVAAGVLGRLATGGGGEPRGPGGGVYPPPPGAGPGRPPGRPHALRAPPSSRPPAPPGRLAPPIPAGG